MDISTDVKLGMGLKIMVENDWHSMEQSQVAVHCNYHIF